MPTKPTLPGIAAACDAQAAALARVEDGLALARGAVSGLGDGLAARLAAIDAKLDAERAPDPIQDELDEVLRTATLWWEDDAAHFAAVASNQKPTGDVNVSGAYMTSYPVEACVQLARACGNATDETEWMGDASLLVRSSMAQRVPIDLGSGLGTWPIWVRPSGAWQWWDQCQALRAYVPLLTEAELRGVAALFSALLARPWGDAPSVREWCLREARSGRYQGQIQQAARMALALTRAGVDGYAAFADDLYAQVSAAAFRVGRGHLTYLGSDGLPFDTGHGGRVAAWLAEIDSPLLHCAARGWRDLIASPDAFDRRPAFRIDGGGERPDGTGRRGTVWDGWGALALRSDEALDLLRGIYRPVRDGTGGQGFIDTHASPHARLSIAGHLAAALARRVRS